MCLLFQSDSVLTLVTQTHLLNARKKLQTCKMRKNEITY